MNCKKCETETEKPYKSGICKSCSTKLAREYRIKNKEKISEYNKKYGKQYYIDNQNKILNDKKIHYKNNKNELIEKAAEHYKENTDQKQAYNKKYYKENKDTIIEKVKEYRDKNIDKIKLTQNEYSKNRRKTDFEFRLKINISANVGSHFKSNNLNKNRKSSIKNLSYSISVLKEHLENQFEPWMNWLNYGLYRLKAWDDNDQSTWTWQLDHIIPHSTFKYKSVEDLEFKKCWALDNLRPLSSKQNFLDGMSRIRH